MMLSLLVSVCVSICSGPNKRCCCDFFGFRVAPGADMLAAASTQLQSEAKADEQSMRSRRAVSASQGGGASGGEESEDDNSRGRQGRGHANGKKAGRAGQGRQGAPAEEEQGGGDQQPATSQASSCPYPHSSLTVHV